MKIFPIASSSDGNITLIESPQTCILIDCGIGIRALTKILGTRINDITAMFITHEHSDHIEGAGPVGRKLGIPIYIHEHSYEVKKAYFEKCNIVNLKPGIEVTIKDLTIDPFSTKHDCRYSFGFVIKETDGPKLCYLTDTGMVTKLMLDKIKECNTFFIEADYDVDGLKKYAEYDDFLKERISGNFGHLSNDQAIEVVKQLDLNTIKKIIFGHLSKRTNSPECLNALLIKNFPNNLDKFLLAPLSEAETII